MNIKEKQAIRDGKLIPDGETGDGKRAFFVADTNDSWCDLRLELDTDDCDSDYALAYMKRVTALVNMCAGMEIKAVAAALKAFKPQP